MRSSDGQLNKMVGNLWLRTTCTKKGEQQTKEEERKKRREEEEEETIKK